MADRDYSHRDVIDKLGVKPGHVVAANVVDNKVCSISEVTSGMRFAIRRIDRRGCI